MDHSLHIAVPEVLAYVSTVGVVAPLDPPLLPPVKPPVIPPPVTPPVAPPVVPSGLPFSPAAGTPLVRTGAVPRAASSGASRVRPRVYTPLDDPSGPSVPLPSPEDVIRANLLEISPTGPGVNKDVVRSVMADVQSPISILGDVPADQPLTLLNLGDSIWGDLLGDLPDQLPRVGDLAGMGSALSDLLPTTEPPHASQTILIIAARQAVPVPARTQLLSRDVAQAPVAAIIGAGGMLMAGSIVWLLVNYSLARHSSLLLPRFDPLDMTCLLHLWNHGSGTAK